MKSHFYFVFREQKTESLVKNEEKKQNEPQIRGCEQPSTSRGVKFRVKSRNTVTKTSKTRGKKRKVASSVINKPPQDLNETPKPLMTPSQKLFLEFSLICRNKLHGECMGDINCNNNHIFPDARMMCQLLDQMHIFDIDKFIASLYKSIPLSLIYFPELSQFFARRNMKNHLIEAISMAESNVMLLQNYKWIVHGLICCSVTLPKWVSVRILLENRKNFSIHANAVVVDIIAKTETESYFLHQLIDISYATVQIFTVEIFHAYMMKAMQDVRQIDLWEVLIGNILDYLTNQGLNQYFNEQLSSRFVMWLNQRRN